MTSRLLEANHYSSEITYVATRLTYIVNPPTYLHVWAGMRFFGKFYHKIHPSCKLTSDTKEISLSPLRTPALVARYYSMFSFCFCFPIRRSKAIHVAVGVSRITKGEPHKIGLQYRVIGQLTRTMTDIKTKSDSISGSY